MTNNYDSAYDELPSCCCDGMEENEKLKRENAELRAMVNGLREGGINNSINTAIEALRFLASNSRPSGGQVRFNAEHLYQIAQEAHKSIRKLQPRSIAGHDMRIAERVRGACANLASWTECGDEAEKDIRNINLEELLK